MRPVISAAEAMAMVVESPWAKRGYEELVAWYDSAGMPDKAEVVRFLVAEKFCADDSCASEGQLRDDI